MKRPIKLALLALIVLMLAASPALAQPRGGGIVRFGETARVRAGESVRSVTVFGADAIIAGRVRDDVVAIGGDVRLLPSARVQDDAVAIGGRVRVATGARVGGERVSSPGLLPKVARGGAALLVLVVILRLVALVVMLGLAALTAALFPRALTYATRMLEVSPGPAFLWGIIAFILIFPLIILFALMVVVLIGIVLLPLFLLFLLVAYLFGYFAVSLWVGQRLVRSEREDTGIVVLRTLLGAAVLGLVGLVPFFGGLVNFVAGIFGLGVALMTKFGTGQWGARRAPAQQA